MDLKEILVFEEYGGDMAYIYEALKEDVVETVFDKLACQKSWKDKLSYLESIGVELDGGSYADDKFNELKEELLDDIIENMQHDCSYYPENAAYYDRQIEKAREDLEL